jgi:uncharacterized protein (TIGR03086 family)
MADDPVAPLSTALDATGEVVAGVRADQWQLPTPCSDWTVRQLLNHLVGGQRLFTRVLHGEPLPDRSQLGRRGGEDQLGDDPSAAYRETAEQMLAAFRAPGVLERTHTIPAGALPGPAVVHIRITETLVHGWDLAVATGQQPAFPDEIVEPEIEISRRLLGGLPPGRSSFGSPQAVTDDAPAIDRLAALLGRTPPSAQTGGRSS